MIPELEDARQQSAIDSLLRRSLGDTPAPSLTQPDFEQRLDRRLRQQRRSAVFVTYRRALFAGYGLLSIGTSAAVMRAQGLGWEPIAITVSLALLVIVVAATAPHFWKASSNGPRRG